MHKKDQTVSILLLEVVPTVTYYHLMRQTVDVH